MWPDDVNLVFKWSHKIKSTWDKSGAPGGHTIISPVLVGGVPETFLRFFVLVEIIEDLNVAHCRVLKKFELNQGEMMIAEDGNIV